MNPIAPTNIDGYCYDASGNLLDDGGCIGWEQKYTYDGEGRLASSNFGQNSYLYDAEGNRVAKQSSGALTNVYFYDLAGHVTEETDGSGNPLRTEIYAGGRHLATFQGGTYFYTHTNWLGTEAARSDGSGNLCETLSSLPFGDNQQTSGSCSPSPNFFTGKERDTESGNDYFMARYYDSRTGTFCSADPLAGSPEDPQSWNRYPYGRNDPIDVTDPSGQHWWNWALLGATLVADVFTFGQANWALEGEASAGWIGAADASAAATAAAASQMQQNIRQQPQQAARTNCPPWTPIITAGGWPNCREKRVQPMKAGAPGASHLGTWETSDLNRPFPGNADIPATGCRVPILGSPTH